MSRIENHMIYHVVVAMLQFSILEHVKVLGTLSAIRNLRF